MVRFEKVFDDANTIVKAYLDAGDRILAASGAMVSMTDSFEVGVHSGGFKKAFGRMFSTQSVFLTKYDAKREGEIILSPIFLGDINILPLDGSKTYTLGQSALLAYEGNIELNTRSKGGKGFISGEGLFQLDVSGVGTIVLAAYGKILKKNLRAGERFIVDTNHIVLRDSDMEYSVELVTGKGISSLASGEGYIMKFTGPGEIWYQSKNPSYLLTPGT